jgi:hypothetical protein
VGAPSKAALSPTDVTPPVIGAVVSPQPNELGWHSGPVTVTWTVEDPDTSIISSAGCDPTTVTAETAGLVLTCSAVNGNSLETLQTVVVRIDFTAPVVSFEARVPQANAAGWNNTNVTLPFTSWDNLSGVVFASASSPLVFTTEGVHTPSVTVRDAAGNVATFAPPAVKIDKTAPEAYLRFDPATRDLVAFGVDSLSGVAGGAIAPAAARLGARPAEERTFTIADLAGNIFVVVSEVRRAGHQIQAEIRSLQYNGGVTLKVTENRSHFEYAVNRSGALSQLHQRMQIGTGRNRQEFKADYHPKTNVTDIKSGAEQNTKAQYSGLLLLRMRTSAGTLQIEVNP